MPALETSNQRGPARLSSAPGLAEVQAAARRVSWSVDRWGRLIAGGSVLVCTVLGLLHNQLWLLGSLLCAFNLVLTSFTDRCAVRSLLRWLGAREREDLFLPGGKPRHSRHPTTAELAVSMQESRPKPSSATELENQPAVRQRIPSATL